MRVAIQPEAGTLSASATATLSAAPGSAPPGVISFFLNRDLEITGVEVDGVPAGSTLDNDLERAPFAPSGRRFSVAAPVEMGESVRLVVRYHGRIGGGGRSVSRITSGLTELNLYAAWFPLFEGPQGFDYELEVTAPPVQTVVGNGDVIGAGGSSVTLRGRSAAGDLPLLLSPALGKLPEVTTSACNLEIVASDLPAGVAAWLSDEVPRACGVLAGRPAGKIDAGTPVESSLVPLRIAIVPREGDGYARPPLVVIPAGWFTEGGVEGPSTPEEKDEALRRVFHEMAHAFAPLADTHTSDDWINEGLAEHLAREALAAAGRGGAVARYVRSDMLELAERSPAPPIRAVTPPVPGAGESVQEATPPEPFRTEEPETGSVLPAPISATRRADPDAHLLYYVKGAMIFRMVGALIGEEALDGAVRDLRREFPASSDRRMTTGDLVQALERASGFSFDRLRAEWIDASGLPEFSAEVEVERPGSDRPDLTAGRGRSYLVSGSIVQTGPRPFHLLLPLVARGVGDRATTHVKLSETPSKVVWRLPFRPEEVLVDPDLTVPRVDATVREALRLLEAASRAAASTREGLAAEKAGDFQTAIEKYGAAIAADPRAILPRYRRARVHFALARYDLALRAHAETARAAERRAVERMRLLSSIPPGAGAAEAPPPLWLPEEPDLRSWNEVRTGQVHDRLGERRAARRAYRRALALPDLKGAHVEARRFLDVPYRTPDAIAPPAPP